MDVTRPRATKASQITWDLAATLIASLENGGVNEISVAGLSGALVDTQPFDESLIENGGAQEISVAGLSGIIPDNATIISGSFTGNSTVNRAIPHGLGRTPEYVFLVLWFSATQFHVGRLLSDGKIFGQEDDGTAIITLTVTAPDATNIYVGNATDYKNSFNYTGETTYWFAVG